MESPLIISEENGIVIFKLSGKVVGENLDAFKEFLELRTNVMKDASLKVGKKVNALFDISEFSGEYDPSGLETMADFAKANEIYTNKTAVFGGSYKAIAAGEITAALANREKIRFFPTKKAALEWLNAE